jgi:hypothetical protein
VGLFDRLQDLFTHFAAMPAPQQEPFSPTVLNDASPEAVEMWGGLVTLDSLGR